MFILKPINITNFNTSCLLFLEKCSIVVEVYHIDISCFNSISNIFIYSNYFKNFPFTETILIK